MSDQKILALPKQASPGPRRTASALYNFVPLPEVVVKAVEDARNLPDHNTCSNNDYPNTGYFEVTLSTRSPLYVRCPLTREEFDLGEQDKDRNGRPVDNQTLYTDRIKNTPHFFYTRDPAQPVIPGSSLRGMLRSMLEIVSYGKVQWVTDEKLFFRTVDNSAVGIHYRDRMVGNTSGRNKVEAGFLRQRGDRYFIQLCSMGRVSMDILDGDLHEGRPPYRTPRWNSPYHQYRPVWVQVAANGWLVERLWAQRQPGSLPGRLVITGDINGKQKEFVFLQPADDAEEIPVPEEMIARFHDDDQITQWQERAFPKDKPNPGCRERNGMLRKNLQEGDPVFFLRESSRLTFFGRAQMFRLPYVQRPLDLVPIDLRRPEDIDYAEAMFGFVRETRDFPSGVSLPPQGSKTRAYASRVSVTDATVAEAPDGLWLRDDPITPQILATPKPTAFQHYLVQTDDNKDRLKHYDSPSPKETVLRGHKLYWHQGPRTSQELEANPPPPPNSTQHTRLRPVKPGVQFVFRVYFENLSNRELGALCWVLHPLGDSSKDYCHSLGMGKPLGMGVVKLDATLYLTNRTIRYGSLFDGDNWQTGASTTGRSLSDPNTLEELTREFEQHILVELNPDTPCDHLSGMKRIGILLEMLEWHDLNPEWARPLSLSQFRQRCVLPDPSAFGALTGYAEPASAAVTLPTPFQPVTASPLGQAGAHPTPGSTGTRREWVTLLSDIRNGGARVKTELGDDITCSGFTPSSLKAGDRCRADVTRQGGTLVKAVFKGVR